MKFSVALLKIGDERFTLEKFSSIKRKYNKDLKEKDQLIGNRIIEIASSFFPFIRFFSRGFQVFPGKALTIAVDD